MLVQPTEDEGAPSERPSEVQPTPSPAHTSEVPIEPHTDLSPAYTSEVPIEPQTDPSPRPSPSTIIPNSIGILEIPEDTLDHMETENAQDVGRTREIVGEEKESDENILSIEDALSTDKEKVSTDKEKVSTDEKIETTDEQRKGTDDHTQEGSVTQTTQPPPTSIIFGDDETIAKVLLNMSQAKAVSREKEKGVELKDIEETDRPRPTSTRSLLTLKPLPNIDLKDKGKKKIEEEDKSESEFDGIPEAEKKFKQLASDEEMARKIQEEWEGKIESDNFLAEKLQKKKDEKFLAQQRQKLSGTVPPTKNKLRNQMMTYPEHVETFKHSELKTKKFKEIQALYEKIKRKYPIKEWKTECLGTKPQVDKAEHLEEINQNVVIRSNGQKRYFSTLMRVLSIFDRDELTVVYQLVMDRYQDEIPKVSWKLHGSLGVHTLRTDAGLVIHMLIEKKYPLRKKVLLKMLELKLESEEDSTMALELIRFVKKQIAELEPEDSDRDEKDF
ncbi:hypothetical protein Tco_1292350 [Tanacetum coccineum]